MKIDPTRPELERIRSYWCRDVTVVKVKQTIFDVDNITQGNEDKLP